MRRRAGIRCKAGEDEPRLRRCPRHRRADAQKLGFGDGGAGDRGVEGRAFIFRKMCLKKLFDIRRKNGRTVDSGYKQEVFIQTLE